MKKDTRNIYAVARKLGPALTGATNPRLEVAKKERQKREKMVERRKTEAIVAKYQKARREISLSSKEKENYKSNTGDKINPDKVGNKKYPLQLQKRRVRGKYEQQM